MEAVEAGEVLLQGEVHGEEVPQCSTEIFRVRQEALLWEVHPEETLWEVLPWEVLARILRIFKGVEVVDGLVEVRFPVVREEVLIKGHLGLQDLIKVFRKVLLRAKLKRKNLMKKKHWISNVSHVIKCSMMMR
jgi:hypothetical protein